MLDLLFEYVDLSMTTLCPEKGKMEELEAYYQVKTLLYAHIITALWLFCKKKKKVSNPREIMALSCNVLCMVSSISSKVNIFFMEFIVECCEFY